MLLLFSLNTGAPLEINDVTHSTSVDNLDLILGLSLLVNGLNHSTTIETVDLVQQGTLEINNASQNNLLDNVDLIQQNTLDIFNLSILQTLDNLNLTQQNTLDIENVLDSITVDNLSLTQQHILTLESLTNPNYLNNLDLIQQNLLAINSLLSNPYLDNLDLVQQNLLDIDNLISLSSLNNLDLTQHYLLFINNLSILTDIDDINVIVAPFKVFKELINLSDLPAYIELFKIDCTNIPAVNTVYYVTPMINDTTPIIFGGQEYTPFPIQLTGLSQTSDGAYPRPRIDIANINKLFGTLAFLYGDLVGASVTYIRTFAMYIGSSNAISAPPLKFYIAKKLNHDKMGLSLELRSSLDKERAFLPARQMLKRDFPGLGINKIIR